MDLKQAIAERHSRRTFDGKSLPLDAAVKLHDYVAEYSKIPGVDIRFVNNNGSAFNGLTKSYGVFSGVNDYFLLVRNKNNPKSSVKLGYYGELLVLQCTRLGLNTCWVGLLTVSKKLLAVTLEEDEVVECCIVVGHSPKHRRIQENLIHLVFGTRTKRVTDMYSSETDTVPDWFKAGMDAVHEAPSAFNRQPAHFIYHKDGTVSADVKDIEADSMIGVDLGIAKLHFEIGSGKKFGG